MSAESGIPTFRDANGLWEGHNIEEVASPQGFARNPELVLHFYNLRRRAAWDAQPNIGHLTLAELEHDLDVHIITQNVDNLHERAGSSQVLHLHGELCKVRSTADPSLIYDIGGEAIELGSVCEKGSQLRPHIVWFGEDVPLYPEAAALSTTADFFMIIGTSLQVYPAAGLIDYVPRTAQTYIVDRKVPTVSRPGMMKIEEPAGTGVARAAMHIRSLLHG